MDTIANMLTSILNAQRVRKDRVAIPYSKKSESLGRVLQEKGLLSSLRIQEGPQSKIIMTLSYDEGTLEPRIHGVKRISSPGRRRYVKRHSIPYPFSSTGSFIVSTPQGLMDDKEARKQGLGGELICEIW